MSNQVLFYIMGITGGIFALLVVVFLIIKARSNKGDMKKIRQLKEGTRQNRYSSDVIYQKLYIFYTTVPAFRRYVLKIRKKT